MIRTFVWLLPPAPPLNPQSRKQASGEYATCTGLEFSDVASLVHADMEIVQAAAACFKQKVEEIEVRTTEIGAAADKRRILRL